MTKTVVSVSVIRRRKTVAIDLDGLEIVRFRGRPGLVSRVLTTALAEIVGAFGLQWEVRFLDLREGSSND